MSYKYTDYELDLMRRSASLKTGGMSTFTRYWFSHEGLKQRDDLIKHPPDEWNIKPGEEVPYVPLDWTLSIPHGNFTDYVIIGGWGCGKTLGVGAIGVYYCAMMPNFKFLNTGPVAWQAKQMFDAVVNDLLDWNNRDEHPKRIVSLIEKVLLAPYPKIVFKNGSTMEFLSAADDGARIRSWSGDMAVVDEAGLIEEIENLTGNLGSRLRGQTNGRARLGKLILMSNADYNPALWEKFDEGTVNPESTASLLLTSYDNPYLTEKQLEDMKRRAGGEDKFRQMMMSERPLPKGREFTPELINKAVSEELDHIMETGLERALEGFSMNVVQKAGCVVWERPYEKHQINMLVGDPGQSNPPDRNSSAIFVFDVSKMPSGPAELVAFNWVYGNGSYWPFIYKMEEYYDKYRPYYAGFDATGTQKAMDELVFKERGAARAFYGISFANKKQSMVLALKLLMGKSMIKMPKSMKSAWLQLANWHMPDTKLRQDIASALFMAGAAIHDYLGRFNYNEKDEREDLDVSKYSRNGMNRIVNRERQVPMRG